MFTGLIEEIGTIKAVRQLGGGRRFTVQGNIVLEDMNIGDSIALNGVCQTVVAKNSSTFDVEAVEETLKKTTLASLSAGKKINLERAMKLGDRMGGHLVQGHVDCVGRVTEIKSLSTAINIWISFPEEYKKYIIPIGSICVDGVSLTAAKIEGNKFMLSIIPHTWEMTTINSLKTAIEVNLEFDIIGKYVENLVQPYNNKSHASGKSILDQYIDQPY